MAPWRDGDRLALDEGLDHVQDVPVLLTVPTAPVVFVAVDLVEEEAQGRSEPGLLPELALGGGV